MKKIDDIHIGDYVVSLWFDMDKESLFIESRKNGINKEGFQPFNRWIYPIQDIIDLREQFSQLIEDIKIIRDKIEELI